jgi:hypothetical protein
MKRVLSTVAAIALFTAPAMAQFTGPDYQITDYTTTVIAVNGAPTGRGVGIPTPGSIYSNFSDVGFTGFSYGAQVAAQNQGGNGITGMVMDDLQMVNVTPGGDIVQVGFTVVNGNAGTISVRPRIRFWFDNGSGAPGAYYNIPGNVGFTFNPIAFDGNSVTRLQGTIGAGLWKANSNIVMWAGVTFDNNSGLTGATLSDLNNFGQGIWDANAEVGSSDPNNAYETSAAGSFFTIANPAGTQVDFGYDGSPLGGPPANFGWELVQVPEPATMALVGLGALGLIRRRR